MIRIFVPSDTGARSVGADAVASAVSELPIVQGGHATVVRNGSRGAYWLEPLVEIETDAGRIGFSNCTVADVPKLFNGFTPNLAHQKAVGLVEDLPWFRGQTRLTFVRAGLIDPLSVDEYRSTGGMAGLQRALTMDGKAIVDEIIKSGLRGRGGAAFPAGIKWDTVRKAESQQKYVVCNADEGDSGTFADRLLMEADPFQLIEGMVIAGLAVNATRGYVYLRSEYPLAARTFSQALEKAREAAVIGSSVLGSSHAFDITLRIGGGAYICGEETAMLESLEGKRGVVRVKPPLPALSGLFGQPTVINNVLTFAAATNVLAQGADHYSGYGIERSTGTMPFQLGGNIKRGGLFEAPFGIPLKTLVQDFGGGSLSGRPLRAMQVGGPLGAYMPESQWETPLTYEGFAVVGAMLGHGGIVAFDDTVDMAVQAQFAMEFCAHESCGKCTPCRIGSIRGVEVIERLRKNEKPHEQWQLLEELCETMELGSLCALGGLTPMPVRSVMKHFSGDLMPRVAKNVSETVQGTPL